MSDQFKPPWEIEEPEEDNTLGVEEVDISLEDAILPDAIMLSEDKMITLSSGVEMDGTSVVSSIEDTRRGRYYRLLEMEKNMSVRSITEYRSFVVEYVKDFTASKAAMRLYGDKPLEYCRARGSVLARNGYVQLLLSLYIDEMQEDVIVTRNDVLTGLLKEAKDTGFGSSQSARVAAWKALGKMLGMEIDRSISMNIGTQLPAPITEEDKKAFLEKINEDF